MKILLSLVLGSALLVLPSLAQTDRDISLSEFRQSMSDFAAMVDARQGTTLAVQLQNVPDDTLARWYKAVPDGRRFQQAVSGLKSRAESGGLPARPRPYASQLMAANPRRAGATAMVESQMPMASPAAGITSVTPPDLSLFAPAYADADAPGSPDSHWEGMVNTLQAIHALPSGSAYAQRAQRCDQDTKVLYSVLTSTFAGIKDAADSACEIVPDILVVILGEGTEIPAKEICFGICLALNVLNSAAAGLNGDCDENDGLIQGAEIEAAYNNTLALYNTKLRLKIEKNLGDTTTPMGLFELPSGLGGYLEIARAIVADTLAKMTAASQNANASAANAALAQGDNFYNTKSYKNAYRSYQTAYGYAVK
jgi:hypothetical protein